MNIRRTMRNILCAAGLIVVLAFAQPVRADIVTVLFTGFNPGSPSGMDDFSADLASRFANDFPTQTFSSQVFTYDDRAGAFAFIDGISQVDHLFLVGHSWGGNALIRLGENFLVPNNITADASFQIDSVDIFDPFDPGIDDDVLPSSIDAGFNYYQIATGTDIFQGEQNVQGASNFNAEILFGDPTITHTSIDNYLPLWDEIYGHMFLVVIPEPGALGLLGLGVLALGGMRRQRPRVTRERSDR